VPLNLNQPTISLVLLSIVMTRMGIVLWSSKFWISPITKCQSACGLFCVTDHLLRCDILI